MNDDIKKGLTSDEVQKRIDEGLVNIDETPKTKSVKQIIKDNFLNYFNYLNFGLGIMVFIAGFIKGDFLYALKNCLFMGVIIVNSIISIIEEIISKNITDKLSLLNESKSIVIRDGNEVSIGVNDIVKDDIIKYKPGSQVVVDSKILDGDIEVNESAITGEPNAISKHPGEEIKSGSFIVSGFATAKVIHVGKENYINKISMSAKYNKPVNSVIMDSFTKLLKVLSILIIPIGIIMFITQMMVTSSISESIFTTVASLIGMIPEGLVLLTSSVMAVGVIKLYRVNVLVQQLYAIETLARVDVICLDKTGTLTEGKMKVHDTIPRGKHTKEELLDLVTTFVNTIDDTNPTIDALKEEFKGNKLQATNQVYFSSDRKYSAIELNDESIFLGAPTILDKKLDDEIKDYDQYRVVAIGKKKGKLTDKLSGISIYGFVLLEDVIRPSAKDTLQYFKDNNVDVKIISGDNISTVMSIGNRVGLDGANGINIGELSKKEVEDIIDSYQIFGRVKPEQKKWIVDYLKNKGHTVAMTGDGVNDVMALKASDCAISVKSGTDAARNVSQLILLNDDFNSLPKVVQEGRQTINNVERSGSLLLVKTIYTILLIIFSVVVPQKYFFIPIQLTLITQVTIGAPSFFLALEPNNDLVKGNFLLKMLARALPCALTVVYNVMIISAFANMSNMSYEMQSTISVYLTVITGLYYLQRICKPFTPLRIVLLSVLTTLFAVAILFFPSFFNLIPLNGTTLLYTFVLASSSIIIYRLLNLIIRIIFHKIDNSVEINTRDYEI